MLWLFPKTAALWGPSLGAYPTIVAAALVAVVLSAIFATLLNLFVEQPCMRARSRLGFNRATEPTLAQVPATGAWNSKLLFVARRGVRSRKRGK
jgi:peptidoglycan/LPS O-acetylase OafA/YrhL